MTSISRTQIFAHTSRPTWSRFAKSFFFLLRTRARCGLGAFYRSTLLELNVVCSFFCGILLAHWANENDKRNAVVADIVRYIYRLVCWFCRYLQRSMKIWCAPRTVFTSKKFPYRLCQPHVCAYGELNSRMHMHKQLKNKQFQRRNLCWRRSSMLFQLNFSFLPCPWYRLYEKDEGKANHSRKSKTHPKDGKETKKIKWWISAFRMELCAVLLNDYHFLVCL